MFYFNRFFEIKIYKILEARLFACLMTYISPKGTDAIKTSNMLAFL
jgi:hypothetical protein